MSATDPPATAEVPLSISALLSQVVDYAGLFPPAGLDMASTVSNYARYVADDDAWMLGRLIVPADRLDEMETVAGALLPADDDAEPWHLSVLTAPGDDERLPAQLERIEAFNRRHETAAQGLARIDVLELRASGVASLEAALETIPDELFPFFEIPIETDPRGLIAGLVGSDAGAKVRTGGLSPELYPTPPDLARFVAGCAAAQVPFKATAGLHHPLRHHSAAAGTDEFGFLNVFVGAGLVRADLIDAGVLEQVLVETDPGAFRFDDEHVAWREHRLGADQIASTRDRFAISFGSCSFDEPRADLRAMKLL